MASNDDNADNAPTSAGAGPGDETLVVPPPKEADPQLAWSLDADDDTVPVERQSWGLAWGQAAVVLSTAAVVAFVIAVVGWTVMRSGRDTQPLPQEAHPTAGVTTVLRTVVTAAPKPSTVTVQATPTTVTVEAPSPRPRKTADRGGPEPLSEAVVAPRQNTAASSDDMFIATLKTHQITVFDPSLALRGAHSVCSEFDAGKSRAQIIAESKAVNPAMTELGIFDFISAAVQFYCPEYTGVM